MNFQKLFEFISKITLSRRVIVILTVAAVVSCISTYVVLTKRSTDIDTVYWLLNLDLVLLLMMATVIAHQLVKLWSERKRGAAGSKLHVKLVLIFGLLAATPAILMAIFSSIFLYFGINAWFNDRVSTAVYESLAVAQAYLKEHKQVMRADVLAMANDLNRASIGLSKDRKSFDAYMRTESELRNLPEAIVVNSNGKVLASSSLSLSLTFDKIPRAKLQEAQKGEVLLMTGNSHDRIRALVNLDRFLDAYLYVGRLVDATVLAHMQTAENAVREYTTLKGRQSQLQVSVTAMFMAIALILLLAAIWFGLFLAGQLVKPIGELILAAERVRLGDLSARVEESSKDDEMALLGKAFNRMTLQIKEQHDKLIVVNMVLDERRRFTEAVLSGASSGVIGIDSDGVITLVNSRAKKLLSSSDETMFVGSKFNDFMPKAKELIERLDKDPDKPVSMQIETSIDNGPQKTFFLTLTSKQGRDGAVVTIDDISKLISAQRTSAWADVARRIAHEIKNPLTPIQLSAERLKRKYLPQIDKDKETFEKCTDTIIRQVKEIGHMVNEFSSYARMPVANKKEENIVDVCKDALVLQRNAHTDINFGFISSEPSIIACFDRSQLTQVITNLLQNSIDSIADREKIKEFRGNIKMQLLLSGDNISISVEDNGIGLPEKERSKIMDPYVTTKKKGSGLGLAIVKKIMEEHNGSIVLDNNVSNDIVSGVKATIVFQSDMGV